MSTFLLHSAAGLAILVGLAHSYLGERYVLIRLFRRSALPPLFGSDLFTRRTLRFAWHLTSVAWWGFAALLLQLPFAPTMPRIANTVAATFLVTALITAIGSRGRHLAWIVFLAIAAACWLAVR